MNMIFYETPAFTRYLSDYMDDDEYRKLQTAMMKNPEKGAIIKSSGGFRKLRWRDQKRGKGKRGGLRIIYYFFEEYRQIWFFTLYNKDEAVDLTREQKRVMKHAIKAEKAARKLR